MTALAEILAESGPDEARSDPASLGGGVLSEDDNISAARPAEAPAHRPRPTEIGRLPVLSVPASRHTTSHPATHRPSTCGSSTSTSS